MKHASHDNYTVLLLAIILFVAGLLIRYIIGRRRFNRRGVGGLQHFKSYNTSLIIPVMERVLNIIGALMILAGIALYFIR
ncbi:MAG: hypothetical protein ABIX36_17190 [Mucilaginibacter sp.]|uniref:hypothetical protein n=1 Tax=Mucilaginibacter sp. TaxID=1882438 RepID=UPI003266CA17